MTRVRAGLAAAAVAAAIAAPFPVGAGEGEARRITTDHWSYQPVRRPEPPRSGDPWVQGAVDEFILARLKPAGLSPSPPADPRTLIRRLYLVMHGQPPSPEEVETFLNDPSATAYDSLVERVLASHHYGERWARHWLDVVRYADSNGFETNRERKNAWPYRDYVIDAFNSDRPYDLFVKEQLAGDALGRDEATGFLVAGPYDIVTSPDPNLTLMQREDELADMVNTTGTAFLGVTMGCARCHDHKFDPVPQRDYFAMKAVFAGVRHGERPWRGAPPDSAREREIESLRLAVAEKEREVEQYRFEAARSTNVSSDRRPPVNAVCNVEEFEPVSAAAVRFTIRATSGGEACIDELEVLDRSGRNVALASAGATATASGSLEGYPIHRLEHVHDGRTGNDRSWIASPGGEAWVQIAFPEPVEIGTIVWSRDRGEKFGDRIPVRYEIAALTPSGEWIPVATSADREPFMASAGPNDLFRRLPAPEAAAARRSVQELAALRDRLQSATGTGTAWLGVFEQPGETRRLHRGDPMQPREVVAPGALSVLQPLAMAPDEPEQQRRLRLGEWIASRDNPLTARVMVNRIWHYIFGTGIVDTPGDLGVNGSRPVHPELLDWLADEFMASGWSVKHIQRILLRSATFRQSSAPREDALAVDRDARLLWRFPPRRLEAEAIRDSILAVSGALNPQRGGPGFYLMDVEEENVMHYHPKEEFTPAEFRRMVYQFRIRQTSDVVFGAFDCPDGSQIMPRRSRSNTPLQALNLFNSRFILQQADFLASRLQAAAGRDGEQTVRLAYELAFSRPPDDFELREGPAFLREWGLGAFCRAIFNTSEFLFVF